MLYKTLLQKKVRPEFAAPAENRINLFLTNNRRFPKNYSNIRVKVENGVLKRLTCEVTLVYPDSVKEEKVKCSYLIKTKKEKSGKVLGFAEMKFSKV